MLKRLLLAALAALGALACAVSLYYWNEIRTARSATAAVVAKAFDRYGRQVSIKDLPVRRMDVLLRIEDPTFCRHRGVDLATPGAGMTTIAQGLVKLLYFPNGFKPGLAKIRQTLIAEYAFDDLVSKDDQLALYLNTTYFGSVDDRPVHGIARAAEAYFGKSFRALTDDEFIALIGMTIAPSTLKPGTPRSAERVARIKKYLAGEVRPGSVLDVEYIGKSGGTFLEEALMSFLRVLTHAEPMVADDILGCLL